MLLLDFASQSDRVSSHVPKGNDIDNVTIDVIDDFVEAVHHIASSVVLTHDFHHLSRCHDDGFLGEMSEVSRHHIGAVFRQGYLVEHSVVGIGERLVTFRGVEP